MLSLLTLFRELVSYIPLDHVETRGETRALSDLSRNAYIAQLAKARSDI